MEGYTNQACSQSDEEKPRGLPASTAPLPPPRIPTGNDRSEMKGKDTTEIEHQPTTPKKVNPPSHQPEPFPEYEPISNFTGKQTPDTAHSSGNKHGNDLNSETDYYNAICADQVAVDLTKGSQKEGVQRHQYTSSYFYNPKDGSYIFPFQEGRQHYLVSQDGGIETILPRIAEKTDQLATRVWREAFAAVRIVLAFPLVLILELIRFLSHDIIHSYLLRLVAMIGDFILKPLLVTLYNSFLLPLAVFIWNVMEAFTRSLEPVVGIIRSFAQPVSLILASFRLVEIHKQQSDREKGRVQEL